MCDAKFRQPQKCDDLEKVTFLKRVQIIVNNNLPQKRLYSEMNIFEPFGKLILPVCNRRRNTEAD